MPRKQSTRRSRKPDNRKRTARRSTKSDTRRRTARRMKGGVGLFEGSGIDTANLSKMTRPSRNDTETRRLMREQGQMARPSRNDTETRRLMREQGQLAKEQGEMEELDELLRFNPELPDNIDQLIQTSSDEPPSPVPMGVVERLADDRLSPKALMDILPKFDEEPSSEQPLKPMLKPIDFEGEAKLAERALQWEEKTSRVAAKKKQSKGKKSGPRVKLTIGKNKSKDGVGTARAKADKRKSDKQKKKKLEKSLILDAEREKRIEAREGRRTGGASSSLSLDSIPLYDLNDLVSPRMRLPQPIQDHQAFDLPEPFSEPMPPNDENDLPEPIQGHQAFDLPDPFPGSISPGDEIGLPMARRGDKSLMGELMKLNSDSSGPSSEKQRLARMKFEKLINEATRRTKKSIKPQNKKSIKPQNKKSIKPKNTIRKLARDIPFSGLNFDSKPTGENVGRFRLNRSLAMDRLRKKRRNQLEKSNN